MTLVSVARRQAGEAIARNANSIADSWKTAVRADRDIQGDDRLPDLLLTNQVPAILADIAHSLTEGDVDSEMSIARRRRGLRFGKLRGLARYDASEIYREFQHLRHAVWAFLRSSLDWNRGDAFEVMLAIDQYLDEVIGASLRGYFEVSERPSGSQPRPGAEPRPGTEPGPASGAAG